jgi:hypothetical protein
MNTLSIGQVARRARIKTHVSRKQEGNRCSNHRRAINIPFVKVRGIRAGVR